MTELALIHRDPPISWPVLIGAMQEAGYSLRDIGGALGVPHTTVQSWQKGSTPNYEDGRALLVLLEQLRASIKQAVQIA